MKPRCMVDSVQSVACSGICTDLSVRIDDSLEYSTQVLLGIMRMHMPYEICCPFVIRDGTVKSEIFEPVAVA